MFRFSASHRDRPGSLRGVCDAADWRWLPVALTLFGATDEGSLFLASEPPLQRSSAAGVWPTFRSLQPAGPPRICFPIPLPFRHYRCWRALIAPDLCLWETEPPIGVNHRSSGIGELKAIKRKNNLPL